MNGAIAISDDLPTGSAGSVGLSNGTIKLSGSLGQVGQLTAVSGSTAAFAGYFSFLASTPSAISGGTVGAVSSGSLTASWDSTFPGGTLYYAQISSSPGFAAPLTSSNTLNLSASFAGLVSNTSYYAQVATAPAGPFTSLGSTITYIEAPTAVYFEEISSHSIVAWAYASGGNAFRLTGGLSGANVARGGVYAGWKADTWAFIAPMSTNRNNQGLAAYGGRLYAFGGHNGVSYISSSESYDVAANSWTARAALPANRSDFGIGVFGGKAYVVGGTLGGPVLATTYEYDFVTNTWATKASLATARSYAATAFIGGTLYTVGGWTGSAFLSSHEAYDPVLDSWSARAAAPATRGSAPSAVLNGALYVVGGTTLAAGANVSRVDSYDPGSNAWTSRGALPYGRDASLAVAAGGKLYHFGGSDGASKRAELDEYDPVSDAWVSRSTAMPVRTGIGVAMLNGKMYVAGGGDAVAVTSTAFAFDFGRSRHFAGLQPNTLYTFKAKARNLVGIETAETTDVSTYTLAAAPEAFAFSFVGASSVSVQWTAAGNPGGTEFQASLAVSSSFASPSTSAWTADMLSFVFSGLSAGSTYFARVRARNAVGVPTDYAAFLSTRTGFAAVAGCGVTRDVRKGGPGYGSITAALAAVPASLTVETCVVVRDTATYAEQVTVVNKATNGFRLRIMADPVLSSQPVVAPPAGSTAAFQVKAASVSLEGLKAAPVFNVGWGVLVSSSDAKLSAMLVQTTATLAVAGLELNVGGLVEFSTVAVSNTRAVYFNGAGEHHNTLYRSTFSNASTANHAVWISGPNNSVVECGIHNSSGVAVLFGDQFGLLDRSTATTGGTTLYAVDFAFGTSSNTMSRSYASAALGRALALGGSYQSVVDSTMTVSGPSQFSTLLSQVTHSTVARSYVYSASGPPLSFQASANKNRIEGSTVVAGGGQSPVSVQSSSFNTFTGSYFLAPGGGGLSFTAGSNANTISFSTVTGANSGLFFQNASLNAVLWSHIQSTGGTAVRFEMGSNGNIIQHSTMVSQAAASYALYLTTSTGNAVSLSLVTNTTGYAAFFAVKANANSIDLSTVTARQSGYSALYLDNAATNTFTRSYFANLAGTGVTFGAGASSNTLSMSTVAASGAAAKGLHLFMAADSFIADSWLLGAGYPLYAELSSRALVWRSTVVANGTVPAAMVAGSSGVVLRDSFVAGPDALNVYSSSATTVELTWLKGTGGSGKALQFLQGSNGLSLSGSTLTAASIGLVVEGGARPPWAFLSFSVTAATGVQFQGGTVVATMNLAGFHSASGVNVDGTGLSAASRVTMRDSAGSIPGTRFESDPLSLVDWVPDPNPVVLPGPFSQVSSNSLVASWLSGHPTGTLYYARASTDAAFLGTVFSSDTLALSGSFSGLSAVTTYYARVATAPAGPFTALGSARTLFGDMPGCGLTLDVSKTGPGYGSISAAVAAVPASLAAETCVVVRDTATYAEQVTVQGKAPNNFRLRIMRDPALSSAPLVAPPALSTAAFWVKNASVTLEGFRVSPVLPISWGIRISSSDALLTDMLVQSTAAMVWAGLELDAWGRVEFSTVSVGQTRGVWGSGAQAHHNTLYRSSFTNASATNHAVWLTGSFDSLLESAAHNTLGTAVMLGGSNHYMDRSTATSNGNLVAGFAAFSTSMTVTRSYFSSPTGTFGLLMKGGWHSVARSTVSMSSPAGAALTLDAASRSTVSFVYAQATAGSGLSVQNASWLNLIEGSTFVALGAIQCAAVTDSTSNVLTGSVFRTSGTSGLFLSNAHFNSVIGSTATTLGAGDALSMWASSRNAVSGSYIHAPGGTGVRIDNGSYGNTISQSRLVSGSASTYALFLTSASGNAVTDSLVTNTAGTAAFFAGKADANSIDRSTVTARAAGYSGLYLIYAATNSFTRSYFESLAGAAVNLGPGANSNSLAQSTAVSPGAGNSGLNVLSAADMSVSDSWLLSGGYGLRVTFSQGVAVDRTTVTSGGSVPGAWIALSTSVSFTDSYLQGSDALDLQQASGTALTRTYLQPVPASGRALRWRQNSAFLSGSTFTVLGSTALSLENGVLVATLSYVSFAASGAVANIDASGLSPASRVTMRDASGPRAGSLYENDPLNVVTWIPDPNPIPRPAVPAECATSFMVRKGGGLECTRIQNCVDQVPAALTGDTCVLFTDSSVYSEKVVVGNKATNGFRLILRGVDGARPTLTPPAGSVTGFKVENDSVTLTDLLVQTTNTVQYGISVTSSFAVLSSVAVDSGGNISGAGIFLSSWTTLSHSSVTVQSGDGVRITGSGNTVAFTTAAGGSAFYLNGASSTTLADSFAYGMYGVFLYHSHSNTFVRTTMRKPSVTAGGAGMFLNDASSNTVTGCFVSNAGGTGLDLFQYANYNLIELSTITAAGFVYTALELGHGRGNRVSRVYVHSANGNASTLSSGISESLVENSTFSTHYTGAAALSTNGSSDTLTGNMLYAPEGTALALNGSSTTVSRTAGFTATASYPAFYVGSGGLVTVRDSSFENAGGDGGRIERASYVDIVRSTVIGTGAGLRFEGASSNTVTASRLQGSSGPGLSVGSYLELFDMTTTTGSGNTFLGLTILGSPAVRLSPAPGVALDSCVLQAVPGAISLEASNSILVATFTGLSFEGGAYGAEALSLPMGSRLTMRDPSGASAGSLYELDPRGVVDWLPDPAPSAAQSTCGDVLVVRSNGGGDCTSIQACVDLIPSTPLTRDFCLLIADAATYQDQVIVAGKQAAGHRIRIEGLLPAARPTLTGTSIENGLLRVESDSVTVRDLILRFPTTEGLVVTAAHASIERVFVEQWNDQPGIVISSWSTLTDSSVNVTGGYGVGLRIGGVGSTVSRTTVTGNGGIELVDASSNVVSDVFSSNDICYGLTLAGSHFNSVVRSTFIGQGNGCAALHVFGGTYNDFDRLYLYDAAGPAVFFDTFMGQNARNSIRRSTAVSDSPTDPAVSLNSTEGFTLSDSWVDGEALALEVASGQNTRLERSVLSAPSPGAALSLRSVDALVVASVTLNAPMLWRDYVTAELSSVTFRNLPPGTTAIVLSTPDSFTATFTAAAFVDSALAVNVDASAAGPFSRLTMRGAFGSRAGPAYETDPSSLVDWLGVSGAAPAAPTPVLTTLGTSSLTWTWGQVPSVWSYDVRSADGLDPLGSASTGVFTLPDLTPASTYAIRLAVQGSDGSQTLSAPSTGHTLAATPTGLTALFVTQSSAAVQWSLNGNPAGTFAELQRSTDATTYVVRSGTLATTAYDSGLIGCTSYYYRVRHRNPSGFNTDFDGPLFVRTPISTPSAPGDLSAASLPGRRIALTWNPSATEGIVAYRLYKDSGTGTVDYSTPYAQFSGTTFSTTTVSLSSGAIHLFGLRASHRCGTEEKNTHAVASAWALESLDGVRASIKVPATGKKISGNRVLVMAELDTGNSNDVSSILFQYRSTGSATWIDIPAANDNHPNPDREQPFFVHWNVTAVADRAYDLRAVASDVVGASDPAPGTITVLVDSVGFEVKETDLGNGKVKKEQAVSNETSNTVATAESGSAVVTKVVLPAGALNTTDATLTATANPPALPPPPAAATSLGASIEITLSNGQSLLSNGQTAAIVFNYPDDNGDGVIDGTQVRAENAEIQTFDVPSGKWKKEFLTTVDKDKKTLTGQTPHFSLFAAFGVVQAAGLDAIRVYPNPYKPNGGNLDEGHPFSRADPLSGVIFDNLPAVVTIKIYTLTGRLVSEFATSAGTGALQWDAKNDQGEDVATGGYFAVITSPGSGTVVKKIGVIR